MDKKKLVVKGIYKIMFMVIVISCIFNIFYINSINTLCGTYASTWLRILLMVSMIFTIMFIWEVYIPIYKKG